MRYFRLISIFVLFFGGAFLFVEAGESSRKDYLELFKQHPNLIPYQGNASQGEIEVILDESKMAEIEKATGRDVGIMKQDKYWLWVNDACLFPNGREGVYGRILWVKALESCPDVAVMPVTKENKFVLNCNFRHATRSWEVELPRGLVNIGEDAEAAAKREAIEETGMVIDKLLLLGEMAPDSGVISSVVPIYLAKVVEQQSAHHEDSEAIEETLFLSISEIKEGFKKGYYDWVIRGESKRVYFRDPFLSYAILMYELKILASETKQ